jgi:hypothetical protein
MAMYQYWGFGLNIASEIEFPELLPHHFQNPQVVIRLGNVPSIEPLLSYPGPVFSYYFNDTELLFETPGVASYYAANGESITVQLDENINKDDLQQMRSVRLYLLATVFAAVLLQRQALPLHASAIIKDGKLTLIAGDSGAGKSTILAEFMKRGHTIFSDDVVVLTGAPGPVLAAASYPMIKLWEDAQEKLEHEMFADQSFLVKHDLNKYGIFFHDGFDTARYPVQKIFILKKTGQDEIHIRELSGSDAFTEVSRQVYRPLLLHSIELKKLTFGILADLAKNCQALELGRPATCDPALVYEKMENYL